MTDRYECIIEFLQKHGCVYEEDSQQYEPIFNNKSGCDLRFMQLLVRDLHCLHKNGVAHGAISTDTIYAEIQYQPRRRKGKFIMTEAFCLDPNNEAVKQHAMSNTHILMDLSGSVSFKQRVQTDIAKLLEVFKKIRQDRPSVHIRALLASLEKDKLAQISESFASTAWELYSDAESGVVNSDDLVDIERVTFDIIREQHGIHRAMSDDDMSKLLTRDGQWLIQGGKDDEIISYKRGQQVESVVAKLESVHPQLKELELFRTDLVEPSRK